MRVLSGTLGFAVGFMCKTMVAAPTYPTAIACQLSRSPVRHRLESPTEARLAIACNDVVPLALISSIKTKPLPQPDHCRIARLDGSCVEEMVLVGPIARGLPLLRERRAIRTSALSQHARCGPPRSRSCALNARGVATARGGIWTPVQVTAALRRGILI
jgi:hypothetical protein